MEDYTRILNKLILPVIFTYFVIFCTQLFLLITFKAQNGLLCADVPLSNYTLTHSAESEAGLAYFVGQNVSKWVDIMWPWPIVGWAVLLCLESSLQVCRVSRAMACLLFWSSLLGVHDDTCLNNRSTWLISDVINTVKMARVVAYNLA